MTDLAWTGVLCVEGIESGDARTFAPGSMLWENLPLPLDWAEEDFGAHDGAEHVGWIKTIARDGSNIKASGTAFDDDFIEYLNRIAIDGVAKIGVSVDTDDVEFTVTVPPEPEFLPGVPTEILPEKMDITVARIRRATIVDIPAFIEAYITIDVIEQQPTLVADASTLTHAGLALQAEDTGRVLMLQRSQSEGDPAAGKWEFPGGGLAAGEDPEAGALREFAEETGLPLPDGATLCCSFDAPNGIYRLHHFRVAEEFDLTGHGPHDNPDGDTFEALCWWAPEDAAANPALREEVKATPWEMFDMTMPPEAPAPDAPSVAVGDQVEVAGVVGEVTNVNDDGTVDVTLPSVDPADVTPVNAGPAEADSLAASAAPVAPPAAWFEAFDLDGPTPLTITADGRVFGHLATWDSCHRSGQFANTCVRPPSDPDPSFFELGEVITAEGSPLNVGVVTVGGGHAARNKNLTAAIAHYDDVSTGAAVVKVHEDEWGIGLFGALTADATPEQVATLRRSPLSGDWRKERGRWRLVAAHGVPVPGYPVPRSLVASVSPAAFIVEGRVARQPSTPDLRAAADRLAREVGRDRESLVASFAAIIHEPVG